MKKLEKFSRKKYNSMLKGNLTIFETPYIHRETDDYWVISFKWNILAKALSVITAPIFIVANVLKEMPKTIKKVLIAFDDGKAGSRILINKPNSTREKCCGIGEKATSSLRDISQRLKHIQEAPVIPKGPKLKEVIETRFDGVLFLLLGLSLILLLSMAAIVISCI